MHFAASHSREFWDTSRWPGPHGPGQHVEVSKFVRLIDGQGDVPSRHRPLIDCANLIGAHEDGSNGTHL